MPRSFSPLFFLKWLYVLLNIVQLLSTSVHVVSPWYVKTLEAFFSFHSTESSTTLPRPRSTVLEEVAPEQDLAEILDSQCPSFFAT